MKYQLMKRYNSLLGKIASKYIAKHNPTVIGITGSVGKTSSRMIITQILQRELKGWEIYSSPQNFNSELGLVFSIFKIEKYEPKIINLLLILFKLLYKLAFDAKPYDAILLEYGIDAKGDMDYLCNIVKPHYSVFTKLDKVHGEFFETVDEIGDEKFKLMQNTKVSTFLNDNDDYARTHADELNCHKHFYFAEATEDLKPSFSDYQIIKEKGTLKASYNLNLKEKFKVSTNLIGKENAAYIALAYKMATEIRKDFDLSDIKYEDRKLNLDLIPGRFTIFEGINDSILVDSSYNASPLSMRKMIENTYNIKQSVLPNYKLILVIGDMRELGKFTEDEHRFIAGVASSVADTIITVGKEMKTYLKDELVKIGYSGQIYSYLSSRDAGKRVKDILETEKALVLFKGSGSTIYLEEAVKYVLKNESDKNNLCRNTKAWRTIINNFFKQ